jgi:hypothetical protein
MSCLLCLWWNSYNPFKLSRRNFYVFMYERDNIFRIQSQNLWISRLPITYNKYFFAANCCVFVALYAKSKKEFARRSSSVSVSWITSSLFCCRLHHLLLFPANQSFAATPPHQPPHAGHRRTAWGVQRGKKTAIGRPFCWWATPETAGCRRVGHGRP